MCYMCTNESCCDSLQLFDNYETAEKGAELAYKELKKFLVKVRKDQSINPSINRLISPMAAITELQGSQQT